MDAEHLEYFKAALEGRASVGWNVWFAANQQALAQQLSRPALLRLKFSSATERGARVNLAALSARQVAERNDPGRADVLGHRAVLAADVAVEAEVGQPPEEELVSDHLPIRVSLLAGGKQVPAAPVVAAAEPKVLPSVSMSLGPLSSTPALPQSSYGCGDSEGTMLMSS